MMIRPIEHWRTLDEKGITMPWYTRPCLEWLVTLPKGLSVFEYGCGVSSEWFSRNGYDTFGVDHQIKWLPKNIYDEVTWGHSLQTEASKYLSFIERVGDVDLIVIDGLFRDDCTEYALKHLKKGGYLIIDNFEQPSADLAHWPKTRELTKNMPLTIYKEPGHPDWQTAVFHNV